MKCSVSESLFLVLISTLNVQAWIQIPPQGTPSATFQTLLRSSVPLDDLIAATERGRRATESQRQELEAELQNIEQNCALPAPARSPFVEGSWVVEYTTAPPPSNGQLGPFGGIAYQEVDLETGRYANILKVPPNDWLQATLEASWREWDGVLLEDSNNQAGEPPATAKEEEEEQLNKVSKEDRGIFGQISDFLAPNRLSDVEDYGGSCWVVTFETLTIRLLGFPLVTKEFDNVQRVWRTTYVDEDTRIVRAGRTGRRDDEFVFYMKRNQ